MAGADLRGFAYVLEPVRQRRQWQLDAAMACLAQARKRLAEREAQREHLRRECVAQAARATQMWAARADPTAQVRLLDYLAALQQRHSDAERDVAVLGDEVEIARLACVARQQELEVLDQHRGEAVKAFATEQHRKTAAHVDQDWSARAGHRLTETGTT